MDKQISLTYLSDELAQVRTKKKEFLEQIEQIIPWGEWEAIIRPCYYKGERGNKPYELDLMLHLHILQNLYNLSDEVPAAEAAVHSQSSAEWIPAIKCWMGIRSDGFGISLSKIDCRKSCSCRWCVC